MFVHGLSTLNKRNQNLIQILHGAYIGYGIWPSKYLTDSPLIWTISDITIEHRLPS